MTVESKNEIQPASGQPGRKNPGWQALFVLAGLAGLLIFQAWAYYFRLDLSLGPRVILQPWLLRNGFVPYENIVDIHGPLVPMILSALRPLVPDGLRLAKLALVGLITLTTLLTFLAGKRKTGWLWGLWAVGFFVIWSPAIGFSKLWYETFLAPIYLIWLLAYQHSEKPPGIKMLVFYGLLGGLAVLIKQQAALVFLTFALWLFITGRHYRRPVAALLRELVLMGLAALIPVAVFMVWQFARAGTLAGTLYWLVGYVFSGAYQNATVLPTALEMRAVASCLMLAPAAIVCALDLRRKGDPIWLEIGLGLCIIATGAVTAYPRFELFHLQAILPAAALVSCLTLSWGLRLPGAARSFALGAALSLSLFWLVSQAPGYRQAFQADRQPVIYEYSNLQSLAQFIRPTIAASDRIYIFPDDESTSNLYYFLQRTPPKFWVFHYPWYLMDWVRAKILATLAQNPPEWVVVCPDLWEAETNAPEVVGYIHEHYQQVTSMEWGGGQVRLMRWVR